MPRLPRHTHRLPYRAPYDWVGVLDFLRPRAIPGVEQVDARTYRRAISIDESSGAIVVSHDERAQALRVVVESPSHADVPSIVDRVRAMFDLDVDPAVVQARLRADAVLNGAVAKFPGIRAPGAWDAFELTVRAILGQQVSVAAATTIAGRVAHLSERPGLFPTPESLIDARLEQLGVMPSRARTIRALASAVASGSISFDRNPDVALTIAALRQINGIGDWTTQYIAMRAFNDRDAFPSGDLILRRALGNCSARDLEHRSDAWRPWRAYAVMLLWRECAMLRRI